MPLDLNVEARRLAELAGAPLTLPEATKRALEQWQRYSATRVALPQEGRIIRPARARAAAAVARGEIEMDEAIRLVAEAEAREWDDDRLYRLGLQVRAEAGAALVAAVDRDRPEILAGAGAEYKRLAGRLIEAAVDVPPGCDQGEALRLGGNVRTSWLRSLELVAELARVQQMVRAVDPNRTGVWSLDERWAYWLRSREWVKSRSALNARHPYGEPGSHEFWLHLAHDWGGQVGLWWVPTFAEVHEWWLGEQAAMDLERKVANTGQPRPPSLASGARL